MARRTLSGMTGLIDGLRAVRRWLGAALWEIGEGIDAADRWFP